MRVEKFEVIVFPINLSDISYYPLYIKGSLKNFIEAIRESCDTSPFHEKGLEEYFLLGTCNPEKEIVVLIYGNKIPNEYLLGVLEHEIGHILLEKFYRNKKEQLRRNLKGTIEKLKRRIYSLFRDNSSKTAEEMKILKEILVALGWEFLWTYKRISSSEILPNVFVEDCYRSSIRDIFFGVRKIYEEIFSRKSSVIKDHFHLSNLLLRHQFYSYLGSFLDELSYHQILEKIDNILKNFNSPPTEFMYKTAKAHLFTYLHSGSAIPKKTLLTPSALESLLRGNQPPSIPISSLRKEFPNHPFKIPWDSIEYLLKRIDKNS